ncbi:MAG: hypothetical protein HWE16_19170 [Gammaproteobacteria bacterium]|nr:hypothetical protein [Gammaproteobacteria bacterium]
MLFERYQFQTHKLNGLDWKVTYDRLTSRFNVYANSKKIYSCLLLFISFRNKKLLVQGEEYHLKVIWLLLWRAKLAGPNGDIIDELLEIRRRKSLVVITFMALLIIVKIIMTITR